MDAAKAKVLASNVKNFGVWDYGVLIVLLLVSIGIGFFFGFISKGLKTTEEYLLGGRRLKPIPVGISIVSSQLTAILLLAVPADMYNFGTQFSMIGFAIIIPVLIINYIYIPVFYNTQISNCYEYLELRFDKDVRKFVTVLFLVKNLLLLPIIMYLPSLSLSQVTGINLHWINIIISCVCMLYTMMGGIKGVIWTDILQGAVMFGSSLIILILALNAVGGFFKAWNIAQHGNRLDFFNMKIDLTTRNTFWNTIFGCTITWTALVGLNQTSVQRIIAMPSIKQAQRALWIFFTGFSLLIFLCLFTSISMYARYSDCDPMKAGVINKPDSMIPYFVQDIAGHLTGMSGLFISSVLSASLSTMSAVLNSVAGVVYYDYIAVFKLFNPTDRNVNRVLMLLVVFIGIYSIGAGFIVAQFKYLFQLNSITVGMTLGAIFGTFTLGMLWPHCNKKGVMIGAVTSFLILLWIIVGTQIKTFRGEFAYKTLPMSVEGCGAFGINVTNILRQSSASFSNDDSFSLYKIAFLWYTTIGTAITIIVAVLVSLCTGGSKDKNLDPRLFSPLVHWALPDRIKNNHIQLKSVRNI